MTAEVAGSSVPPVPRPFVEVSDFYEPQLTVKVEVLDDPGVSFRLSIEADPGAPGQSVDISYRSAIRLAVFLQGWIDNWERLPHP